MDEEILDQRKQVELIESMLMDLKGQFENIAIDLKEITLDSPLVMGTFDIRSVDGVQIRIKE